MGSTPDTVVYAARAIRFENPEKAKRVLLREYARGGVVCNLLASAPVPCGDTLRKMGFLVPDEITMVDEVQDALKRKNIPFHCDELGEVDQETRSKMERAAVRFNEVLRAALDRGDMDELRWIAGGRDDKIAEIYAAVLTQPTGGQSKDEKSPRGTLFGVSNK